MQLFFCLFHVFSVIVHAVICIVDACFFPSSSSYDCPVLCVCCICTTITLVTFIVVYTSYATWIIWSYLTTIDHLHYHRWFFFFFFVLLFSLSLSSFVVPGPWDCWTYWLSISQFIILIRLFAFLSLLIFILSFIYWPHCQKALVFALCATKNILWHKT